MNIEIIHLICTQNFPKTNISYFVIRTRTCTYQVVKNINFLENFTYALNELPRSEWQLQWYFVISLNFILQKNFEVMSFIDIFTKFIRFHAVCIIYVVIYITYRRSHSEMIYMKWRPQKNFMADVFLWILLNFIEQLFYGTSVNGCFCFLQGRTYSRPAIQTLEYCKKVFKINNQKIKTRRLLVSLWLSLTHIWLMFPFWTPL